MHAPPCTRRCTFESHGRSKREVAAALARATNVELGAAGLNPRWSKVTVPGSAEAADAGVTCVDARTRVAPVARLETTHASTYYLATDAADLFIVAADGSCGDPESTVVLPAGRHVLWAVEPRDGLPKTLTLELDDRGRRFDFGKATEHVLGDLAAAKVIEGTARAAQRWPQRGGCSGASYTPDFYLEADQPLEDVELALLWSRTPLRLHVYGPLETVAASRGVHCDGDGDAQRFGDLAGTYAVWIGADRSHDERADVAGTAYRVLVRRKDVATTPTTLYDEIPSDLTLPERALANHYLDFDTIQDGDAWPARVAALFVAAPEQLFVYATADVADLDNGDHLVKAGEPLLVGRSGVFLENSGASTDQTWVYRHDGGVARLPTRRVTTSRPKTIWLPTESTLEPVADDGYLEHWLESASRVAAAEDDAAISTFRALAAKAVACLDGYLEEHDASSGTGIEIYEVHGDEKVTNVGDQILKRGKKKCGWTKLEKAQEKLSKALEKTRLARAAARLAAVRSRFALP